MQKHHTSEMNLDEQIGQILMVGFDGITPDAEIIDLIKNHYIGNIILFKRNIGNASQVYTLTTHLQSIARAAGHRFPLHIAIDQENGMVRRFDDQVTIFPGNMALGAVGSTTITRAVALAMGQELKALGINMNLAPSIDINNNPANPVIGVRSFGENPTEVARHGIAMVQGYREAGIVATVKHFPGHGDTSVDSHISLPILPFSQERLEQIELVPFQRCIEASTDAIMTAHLSLPQLIPGANLPATVSPEIIRSLLREKFGYQGVIMTDCLEMSAITKTVGAERGTVMALQAGHDIALISHRYERQKNAIAAIKAAIDDGTLTSQAIAQAAERVLTLKDRYLSWNRQTATTNFASINSSAHQQLSNEAFARSTTLVRNQQQLLPLQVEQGQRISAIFLRPARYTAVMDIYHPDEIFAQQLRKRHANTHAITFPSQPTLEDTTAFQQAISEADILIAVTINANLDTHQAQTIARLLQSDKPLIGIAAHNPYDLLAFPQLETYLVTYEYTPPALQCAVQVIFGEIVAEGKLPVEIPGMYTIG